MPELTKTETEIEETDSSEADRTWETDQRKCSYYYDDAYGYEAYDPDAEADEADEDGEE